MKRPAIASYPLLLRLALVGLSSHRGRSVLTILAMAIATASVVVVISIGLFGRQYVLGLIEGVGTNLVIAYGQDEGVNPARLSFEDAHVIAQRVPRVAAMAPVVIETQLVSIRRRPKSVRVVGTPPAFAQVRNLVSVSGRFYTEHEETRGAKVATISRQLALQLFGTESVRGKTLRLFDLNFAIVGVYRESVESAEMMNQSDAAGLTALVPISTFRNLSDAPWLSSIYLQATDRDSVPIVVGALTEVLAERHQLIDGFTIMALDQFLVLAERISAGFMMGLLAIAGISLLVGGIGIMNIMLVTVRERTRDIAVRLAIGAGRRDILYQFLIEAGILSLTGGFAGLLAGAVVPWWLGQLYSLDVPISTLGVVVAFAVSVGVGMFFGFYPARRAANTNLVDSLTYG